MNGHVALWTVDLRLVAVRKRLEPADAWRREAVEPARRVHHTDTDLEALPGGLNAGLGLEPRDPLAVGLPRDLA